MTARKITVKEAQFLYENNIRFQYWDENMKEWILWACDHPNTPDPEGRSYGPSLRERRKVSDNKKYKFRVEVE